MTDHDRGRDWSGAAAWPLLLTIWLVYSVFATTNVATPFLKQRPGGPSRRELLWIWSPFAGLWLFISANRFGNPQWNTGVRYTVPAVPSLFVAAHLVVLWRPFVRRRAVLR